MGSACCKGHPGTKNSTKQSCEPTAQPAARQTRTPARNPAASEAKERPTPISSIQFDVVVPDRSRTTSPQGLPPDKSASFAAFDQTMRTARGENSVSQDNKGQPNNTASFDANLSFTNNYTDIDQNVVRAFLQGISTVVERGDATNNILSESVVSTSQGGAPGSPMKTAGAANVMTAEDDAYVQDGKTLEEKIARLNEVEEVLRQNIFGSWRMNSMLIQLAIARVVPTLRERRRRGSGSPSDPSIANAAVETVHDGQSSGAGRTKRSSASAGKRPVVVIHAVDLDVSRLSDQATSTGTPRNADDPVYSPAHIEGSASNPPSKAVSKQHSQRPTTPISVSQLNRSMSHTHVDPQSSKVEHYEMLALSCRDITVGDKVGEKVIGDTWDFLSDDANTTALSRGDCLFRFMCGPMKEVDKETLELLHLFTNLSSFADEEKENNTPRIDVYNEKEQGKYIVLGVKAMYMLPGVKLANITPKIVSSREYQLGCQPSSNKLQECDIEDTFRLTTVVVKLIFSLTVQFKVSEITDPDVIFSFKSVDGIVPAKVLMLERTKRHISKVDATAKVRSMLIYYPVNGGVLVNSHTFVYNTSIPKMIAKLVNSFGAKSASASSETAYLTRKYMIDTYGDSRKAK